jgi:hypothetical protein
MRRRLVTLLGCHKCAALPRCVRLSIGNAHDDEIWMYIFAIARADAVVNA